MRVFWFPLLCGLLVASCERPAAPVASVPAVPVKVEEPWISGNALGDWQPLKAVTQAAVAMKDGVLELANGDGVSGVKYTGTRPLPVVDYEISYEAMKVRGVDFFGAVTFPVRELKTCVTFVNGGWGGGVTGISCINHLAANENATTAFVSYKEGQWYKFRVQVTAEVIAGWVDEKMVFKTLIKDKVVGMRLGEIEDCAPLGFATYMTKGAVRNLQFRKLAAGELKLDPDAY